MGRVRNTISLKGTRRRLRRDQTEAEKVLWYKLRNRQFYGIKFFRQYSIVPYILDFFSPALKLAVEVDGGGHAEEEILRRDEARSRYLELQDIEVMRFWNNDVLQNIKGVLEEIARKKGLG